MMLIRKEQKLMMKMVGELIQFHYKYVQKNFYLPLTYLS